MLACHSSQSSSFHWMNAVMALLNRLIWWKRRQFNQKKKGCEVKEFSSALHTFLCASCLWREPRAGDVSAGTACSSAQRAAEAASGRKSCSASTQPGSRGEVLYKEQSKVCCFQVWARLPAFSLYHRFYRPTRAQLFSKMTWITQKQQMRIIKNEAITNKSAVWRFVFAEVVRDGAGLREQGSSTASRCSRTKYGLNLTSRILSAACCIQD